MSGSKGIRSGRWRTHAEPIQVVSGPVGKDRVHFEAPPSSRVSAETKQFIAWFNDTGPGGKRELKQPVVRSAIAHVYYMPITGASKATATRDLQDLATQGLLAPFGGGRSRRYNLNL
ncbi:MAG: hypothetical protein AB7G68_08750 [Nitrospiraceae bacterium]